MTTVNNYLWMCQTGGGRCVRKIGFWHKFETAVYWFLDFEPCYKTSPPRNENILFLDSCVVTQTRALLTGSDSC